MKRSVRLAALVAALLLLAASRCSSFEEAPGFSLPPTTQTGTNTIGFVLDGQVWRDYGMSCSLTKSQCDSNQVRVDQYSTNHALYALQAGLTAVGRNEHFTINLGSLPQPSTYTSSNSPNFSSIVPALDVRFDRAEGNTLGSYVTRRSAPFQVVVSKLDTVNRIISGTFGGTLRGLYDSTRTLTLSDGRFDVRYRRN